MLDQQDKLRESLQPLLKVMAFEGMQRAATGLSTMLGENLAVSQPDVRIVPITEIPALLGGPESEAVGIYLRSEGEMAGQMILVLPLAKSLEIADLVLNRTPGNTVGLGTLERSALAEVGNLAVSFFLNAVASVTGLEARPTPPAVMVDMVGAILDIIIATTGGVSEHVLMIQASFMRGVRETQAHFWIIPDPTVLNAIDSETLESGK